MFILQEGCKLLHKTVAGTLYANIPSRVGGCIRVHDFNLVLSESFGPLDFGPIKNYIYIYIP